MPTAKPWDPEDLAIREILADLVADAGLTVRALVSATGMKQSRVHSVLTGDRAPATVGEIERLASALGHRGSALVRWAEERVEATNEASEAGRVVEFPGGESRPSGKPLGAVAHRTKRSIFDEQERRGE